MVILVVEKKKYPICHVTLQDDQGILLLCGRKQLIVCSQPDMFVGRGHYGSEDVTHLICHMIAGSCDVLEGSVRHLLGLGFSTYLYTLFTHNMPQFSQFSQT